MDEAPWRRRFRAANVTLPFWARERHSHLLYGSNASGKWEIYAWDLDSDTHRQVTERSEGTVLASIDPVGERVWWFDDQKGDERGAWMVQAFAGGDTTPAVPGLEPGYWAGLALGKQLAIVGWADRGKHQTCGNERACLSWSTTMPRP